MIKENPDAAHEREARLGDVLRKMEKRIDFKAAAVRRSRPG